ncbi:MAG: manganese efflux pump MntP family protein [Bilifractor sp.]
MGSLIKFILNSILLGVGLAMDAFSVSIANGLNEPEMSRKKTYGIAGCYAFFQFAMPMIGWFCVHTIAGYFKVFQKFIPWIALILLLYIGIQMLREGICKIKEKRTQDPDRCPCAEKTALTKKALLIQGIATSIDALSVGFTIASYGAGAAFSSSLIIALVTFVICMIGLLFGKKFGERLAEKATILGGVILIAIGIEIFVTGI